MVPLIYLFLTLIIINKNILSPKVNGMQIIEYYHTNPLHHTDNPQQPDLHESKEDAGDEALLLATLFSLGLS